MELTRVLCSIWEIPDNLPKGRFSAVVAMALPQMGDGSPGKLMSRIVHGATECLHYFQTNRLILSNRWPVDKTGKSLAELEREVAIVFGAKPDKIVTPTKPGAPRIRNTHEELKFAIRLVRFSNPESNKSLHIVDNHLHMRRTLATARKIIGARNDVKLSWQSVGRETYHDYGPGYSQPIRFRHPLMFLVYELFAMLVSKLKGWV